MIFITPLIIALLNILTNHTMLTRKKSVLYCVIAFLLNSILVLGLALFFKRIVTNPMIYKYIFYTIAFLYIGYIYLVFSDSLPIKIFSMFSIWFFSTIIVSISNMTFGLFENHSMTMNIVNSIRIFLQLLFLVISYKWYGKYFKKILGIVNVSTINLMSGYMFLALILLINSFSWNNIVFSNINTAPQTFLFIVFIIFGYFIVFLGISSSSKNILLKQNMNTIKKQSEINYNLANYDNLTGIASKQNIINQISETIAEYKNTNDKFAVIVLDIDKFKSINDHYGHIIGDSAIKFVSSRVSNCLREEDLIGRLGGDEFLIFQKNINTKSDVELLLQRIQNTLKTPLTIDENFIPIDISIGVSVYPTDAQHIDELYDKADKSMYIAKKRLGTTYNFFQL